MLYVETFVKEAINNFNIFNISFRLRRILKRRINLKSIYQLCELLSSFKEMLKKYLFYKKNVIFLQNKINEVKI